MRMSRRQVLKLAGATTIVCTVSAAFPVRRRYRASSELVRSRKFLGTLRPGEPGPLSEGVLRVLCDATEAIVDYPIELSHYERLFHFRAEQVEGYRALYEQFASMVSAVDPDFH